MAEDGEEIIALTEQPSLDPGLGFLMSCYLTIARSRAQGMGGIPSITIQAIAATYDFYRLDGLIETDEFADIMFLLDSVTQDHYRKDQPAT